jgi:hypothetical protein
MDPGIRRDQCDRIHKNDFAHSYCGFVPWDGERIVVALHLPKLLVGWQGDRRADKESINPANAVKISAGIRVAAGPTEFDDFCINQLDYLPQRLAISWAPPEDSREFGRVDHDYLVLRHQTDLAMLRIRFGALIAL